MTKSTYPAVFGKGRFGKSYFDCYENPKEFHRIRQARN